MRRYLLIYLSLSTVSTFLSINNLRAQDAVDWDLLLSEYDQYQYKEIDNRRFKHSDVLDRIEKLGDDFVVTNVGTSYEGRQIKMVSYGNGPVDLLYWSQMHGNEPTATMAIADVLSWMEKQIITDSELHQAISSRLTIHFIPMLNPDGANLFQRRNVQGIDINRDALRLQTPEGRILKRVRDSLNADWGFNLHDQGRTTSVDQKPATISFLAPAFDEERNINEKREDAMQLIAYFNKNLQQYIPNQVGRYWDAFEPRAFGDNIQKWGTRTILIESGGQYADREKQYIRKLNYLLLVSSMIEIAKGSYEQYSQESYFAIPGNSRGLRDVIVRNINLSNGLGNYLTDMAIDFDEVENAQLDDIYLRASIADIGDLSTSGAYIAHDMTGYDVYPCKKYDTTFDSVDELKDAGQMKLLRQGYCHVNVTNPDFFDDDLILQLNSKPTSEIALGTNPSLLFYKDGYLEKALVNGIMIDLDDKLETTLLKKKEL